MIIRRVPLDFQAISKTTGIRNGTIRCMGLIGWVVRDNHRTDGVHVTALHPPEMERGERRISIEDNQWCFHND